MGLVNLLSSYKAVHEIFAGETLPNKSNYSIREIPQSPVVSFLHTFLLESLRKYCCITMNCLKAGCIAFQCRF